MPIVWAERRAAPDERDGERDAGRGGHADGMISIDLFVVPTLSFRLLHSLLNLWHGRRQILWLGVTSNPTAQWVARQFTEAFGWETTPRYIIRDRDRVYGEIFTRQLRTWAFVTGQLRHASHGRMAIRNG